MQELTGIIARGIELNTEQIGEAANALLDESVPNQDKADFLSSLSTPVFRR